MSARLISSGTIHFPHEADERAMHEDAPDTAQDIDPDTGSTRASRWAILDDALALVARADGRGMGVHVEVDGFTLADLDLIANTHGSRVQLDVTKCVGLHYSFVDVGPGKVYRVRCTAIGWASRVGVIS